MHQQMPHSCHQLPLRHWRSVRCKQVPSLLPVWLLLLPLWCAPLLCQCCLCLRLLQL